jgi:2-polyprenyl-3-methyl-5-hydroxy-6-metoxy-1,4-benzoquinol methylase
MVSMINITAKPRCPVCESSGESLYDSLSDQLFGAPGDWSLRRCSNKACELLWLDPCPIETDISKAYQTYYTHKGSEEKTLIQSFLIAPVRNFLVGAVTALSGQRRERKDITQMYLRNIQPGRLLDIGCGDAKFLNRMKQTGWAVEGIDFDAAAASNAKSLFNIDVQIGTLEDVQFPDDTFDAVTMNHVIEHVFDPVGLLKEVRRILKPGGRLIMVTPNGLSMGHRVFGHAWRGLEPPRHIQIFTPAALKTVVQSAHLTVSKAFTTAANAWIVFSASFVLQRHNTRTSATILCGHENPTRGEQFQGLKMHLQEALRLKKNPADGEEIVLIAIKDYVNQQSLISLSQTNGP